MIYLLELVKGVLLAFGVIIGFFIFVAWVMHKANKDDEYDPEDLITPFEKYLQKVGEDEHYEQIKQVENIIIELKAGKVIDDVKQFKIKKDTSLHINDEEGKTALRIINKYIVVNKI